ncbi:hypothetical protein QTI66_32745 [Variovorax sp. J22R133]|uniref:hypothetical protein n=1 Tax=Variovorax brevis TaxID=3053503 RepID=UPI002574B5E7|nr:hypothetical protein [Variovorax sp. J22R133]MDM0116897.1 hypothetical protein [Variovorax sp. J22R133]
MAARTCIWLLRSCCRTAYVMLAKAMGLPKAQCHITMSDARCQQVVDLAPSINNAMAVTPSPKDASAQAVI